MTRQYEVVYIFDATLDDAAINDRLTRYAELLGFTGIYCDNGDEVGDAWTRALGAGTPVVLEVKVDPEIPPLPPHIRVEQAKSLLKALRKGDPEARGIIDQSFKEKILEFLPGR